MKLEYVVGSPNCRKVHAVANHLGIPIELEYHDFFTGELRSPDYLAINPNGMVPVLRDGDFTLWESNTIMRYLADTVGDNMLYPRDNRKRAEIQRWQDWELAHFNRALGVLAFETVAKPNFMNAPPDASAVAWSSSELARHAPILERVLKGREYLIGDDITLADYSVAHLEGFQHAVPFDWSRYPGVSAYFERIRTSQHWVSTAPRDPLAIGRRPSS